MDKTMLDICPTLVILIGIPGSGKSRWAIKHPEYYRICPDEIRRSYFKDISNQSNNIPVWQMAKGMLITALNLGQDTVLDATNVNVNHLRNLYSILPFHKRVAKIFDIEPTESIRRIKNDETEGISRVDVPARAIYRYYGDLLFIKTVINRGEYDSIDYVDQKSF